MVGNETMAAAASLRRAVSRLHKRVRREGGPQGLAPLALRLLHDIGRAGVESATAIAARDGIRIQSLTRILADLERQNLIARQPDPEDRRRKQIILTPAGKARLAREAAFRDTWLLTAMRELLDPEEMAKVIAAAPLIERLGAWRPDAAIAAQPAVRNAAP